MKDFCFLSVGFTPRYVEQQTRLHKSIRAIYPTVEHFCWTDAYPPGAVPHSQSLYGFKVHAVRHALQKGYKQIIWLDTACILLQPVDHWFDLNLPIVAAKDDNLLSKCIGDKALQYFGNPDVTGMHLVGGSVFVFDFNHSQCEKIFTDWAQAETDGMFGSQQQMATGEFNRHRHDEAILAYLMYANGTEPTPCDVMRYNQEKDSIINKRHFK